mgnify:CR=1 FL=1
MKTFASCLRILERRPRERLDDLLDALPALHVLPNRALHEPDRQRRVAREDVGEVRRIALVHVVDDEDRKSVV